MLDPATMSDSEFENWVQEQKTSIIPYQEIISEPTDPGLVATLEELERAGTALLEVLELIEQETD